MEEVILVDRNDNVLGFIEKYTAHREALLHRAFSVFIFNSKGEFLLQQRASSKYHSPNLWTNTCCSHPRRGETILEAANRRLMEEMGMACSLVKDHHFIYKAELDQGMTEYELDYVVLGYSDVKPNINHEEVASYRYISLQDCENEMAINPESFTAWFRIAFEQVKKKLLLKMQKD